MSTYFYQIKIFSLAMGDSEKKSLPSSVYDGKIVKAIGFFPVLNFLDEVLVAIVEVWSACCDKRGFLCVKSWEWKWRRSEESIMEVFIEFLSFLVADT